MSITIQDLVNLSINTANNLIRMLSESDGLSKEANPNLETKLIFPKYEHGNDTIRYSEQEARVQFILALERYYKEIYYSIETPTDYRYSFTGNHAQKSGTPQVFLKEVKGSSAQYDLSLFVREEKAIKQIVDIEFKGQSPKPEQIEKDLLKLFAEDRTGMFFHFIYNNKKNAFANDLKKFAKTSEAISNYLTQMNLNIKHKNILFVFFILNEKKLYIKECKDWTVEIFNDFFQSSTMNIVQL